MTRGGAKNFFQDKLELEWARTEICDWNLDWAKAMTI